MINHWHFDFYKLYKLEVLILNHKLCQIKKQKKDVSKLNPIIKINISIFLSNEKKYTRKYKKKKYKRKKTIRKKRLKYKRITKLEKNG